MPGVLQLETMAQAGGVLILNTVDNPDDYLTFFMKIDNAKFKKKVIPGDTLIFHLNLILINTTNLYLLDFIKDTYYLKNLMLIKEFYT